MLYVESLVLNTVNVYQENVPCYYIQYATVEESEVSFYSYA